MGNLNQIPDVMANARLDLAGNVAGKFSPSAWEFILSEARRRLELRIAAGEPTTAAWPSVIREFISEKYWGQTPDYKTPPKKKDETTGFGISFIWMVFSAFVVTKIAVVWLGQVYTRSDDPVDAYLFFASIALVILNFGYFLWRARKYKD